MKFNFAVFMGHEMPFMGYLLEIHVIFIKMWFVVIPSPLATRNATLTNFHRKIEEK